MLDDVDDFIQNINIEIWGGIPNFGTNPTKFPAKCSIHPIRGKQPKPDVSMFDRHFGAVGCSRKAESKYNRQTFCYLACFWGSEKSSNPHIRYHDHARWCYGCYGREHIQAVFYICQQVDPWLYQWQICVCLGFERDRHMHPFARGLWVRMVREQTQLRLQLATRSNSRRGEQVKF